MKYLIYTTLSLLLAITGTAETPSSEALDKIPADEVLDAYYRAHGGTIYIEDLIGIKFSGSVEYAADPDTAYEFVFYKKRPNKIRYELDLRERETAIIVGQSNRFQSRKKTGRRLSKPIDITDAQQLDILRNEATFDGFLWNLRYNQRFVKVFTEKANGTLRAFRCEIYSRSQNDIDNPKPLASLWLDPETFYCFRREIYLGEDNTLKSNFSDFRQVGETVMPYSIETSVNGSVVSRVKISQARVNPGALDMFFELE